MAVNLNQLIGRNRLLAIEVLSSMLVRCSMIARLCYPTAVRPYGIVVVRNRKCNLIEYSREVEGVYNVEVENSDQGEGCAL